MSSVRDNSLPNTLPKIETLAIGDELLTGKISDTNSAFVAKHFFDIGFPLTRQTVVADDLAAIEKAMREAAARANFVIVFGGLGPTSDDKTAECVASLLSTQLIEDEPSKKHLQETFKARGRVVNEHSLKQVLYPKTSIPIPNPIGFAPGFRFQIGSCWFFCLPGVPFEMKAMFHETVRPFVQKSWGGAEKILTRTWKCLGIPESELQKAMDPVEAQLKDGEWLGYRTRFPENHLSLYFAGADDESPRYHQLVKACTQILAPFSYTESSFELEELVLNKLRETQQKLVVVESCTGGLVSSRLTQVPGASEVYWGGYTVYQVAAKAEMLGVNLENPEHAVSADCSRRLAYAALEHSKAEVAAAITGYLGPTGGTNLDPVGTIYLCVWKKGEPKPAREQRLLLPIRDREQMQFGATTWLLHDILKSV